MHFFLKKLTTTQAANAADCFTVKIKQIKRSDMARLFAILPKQSNRQGGARAMDLTARSFDPRSFDLARPGVAQTLVVRNSHTVQRECAISDHGMNYSAV